MKASPVLLNVRRSRDAKGQVALRASEGRDPSAGSGSGAAEETGGERGGDGGEGGLGRRRLRLVVDDVPGAGGLAGDCEGAEAEEEEEEEAEPCLAEATRRTTERSLQRCTACGSIALSLLSWITCAQPQRGH